MGVMFTNEELAALFVAERERDEDTGVALAAVGVTVEQAHYVWRIMAEEVGGDPVVVGVAFMAGVLVAREHAKLVREGFVDDLKRRRGRT